MTTAIQDRIERDTLIAASQDRVWSLVTEPGFWVGPTGATAAPGQTTVAHHYEYGDFPVQVETIEPKRYISYRWASAYSGEDLREGITTLIEFTLTPEPDGTRLRVVESGFAALDGTDDTRRGALKDNTEGWSQVMDAFKKRAEEAA